MPNCNAANRYRVSELTVTYNNGITFVIKEEELIDSIVATISATIEKGDVNIEHTGFATLTLSEKE